MDKQAQKSFESVNTSSYRLPKRQNGLLQRGAGLTGKTKGRKRHIVTDMMGNILAVIIHAANIHDTVSGAGVAKAAHGKAPLALGSGAYFWVA